MKKDNKGAASEPVIAARKSGKTQAVEQANRVMLLAAQENTACHLSFDRLGAPQYRDGEKLSLSQRARWLEQKYLPNHRVVNDPGYLWHEFY